jgi:hypothetical protein
VPDLRGGITSFICWPSCKTFRRRRSSAHILRLTQERDAARKERDEVRRELDDRSGAADFFKAEVRRCEDALNKAGVKDWALIDKGVEQLVAERDRFRGGGSMVATEKVERAERERDDFKTKLDNTIDELAERYKELDRCKEVLNEAEVKNWCLVDSGIKELVKELYEQKNRTDTFKTQTLRYEEALRNAGVVEREINPHAVGELVKRLSERVLELQRECGEAYTSRDRASMEVEALRLRIMESIQERDTARRQHQETLMFGVAQEDDRLKREERFAKCDQDRTQAWRERNDFKMKWENTVEELAKVYKEQEKLKAAPSIDKLKDDDLIRLYDTCFKEMSERRLPILRRNEAGQVVAQHSLKLDSCPRCNAGTMRPWGMWALKCSRCDTTVTVSPDGN